MNLHDIAKRKDRCLVVESGSIEPAQRGGADGFLGARLAPGSRIRLAGARQFTALKSDAKLNWSVLEGRAEFRLCEDDVLIDSADGAVIRSGACVESRRKLTPFLRGSGLEVGPGANPHVRPAEDLQVRYLEDVDKDEWLKRYHREPSADADRIWQDYLVGDAHHLDVCEGSSLDFIYSSHVFEHLMNPLGVLRNWSAKLRPGGSVLAVIPDARFCFDLRQAPSEPMEFDSEFRENRWTPGHEKYVKWCEGTAPHATPENLIARGYPIHVHYYTPAVFAGLAGRTVEHGWFAEFSLWTSVNHKDFAVRLGR